MSEEELNRIVQRRNKRLKEEGEAFKVFESMVLGRVNLIAQNLKPEPGVVEAVVRRLYRIHKGDYKNVSDTGISRVFAEYKVRD